MTSFTALLQQGAHNAWLFIPSAILLGALHGLEPGHSKTMMAAFIVAIRGTISQAILLGLSATISHTAIVWIIALIGLRFGSHWSAETSEPYFQLASAVLILGIAVWMLIRTYKEHQQEKLHDSNHDHHSHDDESKAITTSHGVVNLSIFETGVPPCFRISAESKSVLPNVNDIKVTTERADKQIQTFTFKNCGDYLKSNEEIPEPHEFMVRLELGHDGHSHAYDVEFVEHGHKHPGHPELNALDISAPGGYQDAHELAHANDIRRRFANKNVTTGQIILFGLTGGLVPCPAAITVLLLCLQLKQFSLGTVLVLCFSIGLALTMVLSGTVAAISVKHISKKWTGFGSFVRRAPYFSSLIIILIGLYLSYQGVAELWLK